jgi:hypothetical protein
MSPEYNYRWNALGTLYWQRARNRGVKEILLKLIQSWTSGQLAPQFPESQEFMSWVQSIAGFCTATAKDSGFWGCSYIRIEGPHFGMWNEPDRGILGLFDQVPNIRQRDRSLLSAGSDSFNISHDWRLAEILPDYASLHFPSVRGIAASLRGSHVWAVPGSFHLGSRYVSLSSHLSLSMWPI